MLSTFYSQQFNNNQTKYPLVKAEFRDSKGHEIMSLLIHQMCTEDLNFSFPDNTFKLPRLYTPCTIKAPPVLTGSTKVSEPIPALKPDYKYLRSILAKAQTPRLDSIKKDCVLDTKAKFYVPESTVYKPNPAYTLAEFLVVTTTRYQAKDGVILSDKVMSNKGRMIYCHKLDKMNCIELYENEDFIRFY